MTPPLVAPAKAPGLTPPPWWMVLPPYMRKLVQHKLAATGHDVEAWKVD